MFYEEYVEEAKTPWVEREKKYALIVDVYDELLAVLYEGNIRVVGRPEQVTEAWKGKWVSVTSNTLAELSNIQMPDDIPFPVKGSGPIEVTVFVITRDLYEYPITLQDIRGPDGEWLPEQRHPETLWSPEIRAVSDSANCFGRARKGIVYLTTVQISFSLKDYVNRNENPETLLKKEVKAVLKEADMEDQGKAAQTPWMRDKTLSAQHLFVSPIHKQPTRLMLDCVKTHQTFVGLVQRNDSGCNKIVWSYETGPVIINPEDSHKFDIGDFVTYRVYNEWNPTSLPYTAEIIPHPQEYAVRKSILPGERFSDSVNAEVAVSILIPYDMELQMKIFHVFLGHMIVDRSKLMDLCIEKNKVLRDFRGRELKLWFTLVNGGQTRKEMQPLCWEVESLHETMYQ